MEFVRYLARIEGNASKRTPADARLASTAQDASSANVLFLASMEGNVKESIGADVKRDTLGIIVR